eukprot:SAG31_NODE_40245_length_282_cov_0.683060_1_plen_69_part_01
MHTVCVSIHYAKLLTRQETERDGQGSECTTVHRTVCVINHMAWRATQSQGAQPDPVAKSHMMQRSSVV